MKKILAMVLAMMLVLSMSAAFAAEPTLIDPAEINKTYTGNADFEPNEVLALDVECVKVEFLTENSEMTYDKAPLPEVTYDMEENKFAIEAPDFPETGRYTYTLTEIDDETAGVTEYDPDSISIQYLAVWNKDNTDIVAEGPYLVGEDEAAKKGSYTNEFNVYNLDITKNLTGNMANYADEFEITVIFTSELEVKSDIDFTVKSVKDDNGIKGENEAVEGSESDWTPSNGVWTKTVTITLGGASTSSTAARFENIPSGVKVSVEETNADEAYTATYTLDDDDYTAASDFTMTKDRVVVITNDYDTEVETGISLDNAPYMILMALVVVAGAALIVKRAAANR